MTKLSFLPVSTPERKLVRSASCVPYQLRPPMPARIVVLASGSGTLLQALIDATATEDYPAAVVAVGTDRSGISALERAERAGLPTFTVTLADYPDRGAWDEALTAVVAEHNPDLVVSTGFMKIVGPGFLARFGGRFLNTHPALLPAFPGAQPVRDALAYGAKVSGATVHLVDAGTDTGPVLAQQALDVLPEDTEAELHERIKTVERRMLVEVISTLVREGCTVTGRKVSLP